MSGHAADTSDRKVLRESWAEPPLPPPPEPPLPPPPFPPSPPTSSGERCTWTGAWEEGQAVDASDALRLHAQTWPRLPGSVPFSVKEIGDGPLRKPPRHNVLTCLVPSSMVSRLSPGHRCLPCGDATQMIPQPTFTENGTDPTSFTLVGSEAGSRKDPGKAAAVRPSTLPPLLICHAGGLTGAPRPPERGTRAAA
jgi:hypothetical protein